MFLANRSNARTVQSRKPRGLLGCEFNAGSDGLPPTADDTGRRHDLGRVMKNVPVDMSQLSGLRCVSAPAAQTDYDSGAAKVDQRTKLPVWLVGVAVRKAGDRKASVIDVKVVAATAPAVAEGDALSIEGLEATLWENNGRAGLAWRAEAVTKAGAPSASSSTGAAQVGAAAVASGSTRASGKTGES